MLILSRGYLKSIDMLLKFRRLCLIVGFLFIIFVVLFFIFVEVSRGEDEVGG